MIQWMIFTPEGHDVFYLWNGTTVILVHVASHEGEHKDWYWPSNVTAGDASALEKKTLKEVAESKRKSVFQITKAGKRYLVKDRGTLTHENK